MSEVPTASALIATLVWNSLAVKARRPLVVGICGAQGSGKSTLAVELAETLMAGGKRCAILSLDDLYLSRDERQRLAREVHPLLATRGVPGTHDVPLGESLFAALDRGEPARLPRFDKALDDHSPESQWCPVEGILDVLLFEGWCVGARPQPRTALGQPINALEAKEDGSGAWRRFVNARLGQDYQRLFQRIDRLVLLAAPSFDVVARWRKEQEQSLERSTGARGMSDEAIDRFIMFYERLTRWILEEMRTRAALSIDLDGDRRPITSNVFS